MIHIGFTGSRHPLPKIQAQILKEIMWQIDGQTGAVSAHSGDCVGADEVFHTIALELGWRTVGHIPLNDTLRTFSKYSISHNPAPYLERNRHIVHVSNQMIACSDSFTEKPKGGTWYTIRYARSLNKPIIIVYPDGTYKDG